MATVPQEWFLNTPVLWVGAVVLIAILRGPLRRAPIFIRKLLKLGIVTLFALGFALLLTSNSTMQLSRQSPALMALWVLLSGLTPIFWIVSVYRILFRAPNPKSVVVASADAGITRTPQTTRALSNIPAERFADIGGMDDAKEQCRAVVLAQLKPAKYERYGVLQNGILLHGPRGTGKTFLARATAGEFGLNFEYISAPNLLNRFIGATGTNIQQVFAQAAARRRVLLFIDEIDALGTGRQDISGAGDPGGAGREFNNIATALTSAIDQYRSVTGFVLMAATNRLDGLDEALIREGRFDVKIRVDLPTKLRVKRFCAHSSQRNPGRNSIYRSSHV